MYELQVTATKVMDKCTADPAVKPGDHFFIRDGDIRIPEGGAGGHCRQYCRSSLPRSGKAGMPRIRIGWGAGITFNAPIRTGG